MQVRRFLVSGAVAILFLLPACATVSNQPRPYPQSSNEGAFFTASDGAQLFVHQYPATVQQAATIYLLAGITGINHRSEDDLIQLLASTKNRVVVTHPRGTGYSDGVRGDPGDAARIVQDYSEIILWDQRKNPGKIILSGHSMSCALALQLATQLPDVAGLVLINPPLKLKAAKGMSPSWTDYVKYGWYYLFAPHTPIVNMAGNPTLIEDPQDRLEAEQRAGDSLLVKYFSMHAMAESQKIMQKMLPNARIANSALLLVCGERDNIIDLEGCDEIYSAWKHSRKEYRRVPDGPHGKKTALFASRWIGSFIASLPQKSNARSTGHLPAH